MTILYIGRKLVGSFRDGGDYGAFRNRKMLCDLYGKDNVVLCEIAKISPYRHLLNILLRRGYGETASVAHLMKRLSGEKFDFVFVDGTNYGTYVDYFSEKGYKVIVFCHNVEYDYYTIKYRARKSVSNFLMRNYIRFNERLAIASAHAVIALNKRDASGIKKYYNKYPDLLLPIFYTPILKQRLQSSSKDSYILFVGANQFVNVEGITWFIKKVTPLLKCTLWVAGSCCTSIREWFLQDEYPNVVLKGFVDDLEELYINAGAVVCPIFSGSGMKTKTVEALRYGKTIYGTTEAFEGIDVDFEQVGGLCNTQEEYVAEISAMKRNLFNEYSYQVFVERYSDSAVYGEFDKYIHQTYCTE